MSYCRLRPLLGIVILLVSGGMEGIHGSQVNWLSRPFATHQTSDGFPLDSSYFFELGAFRDGFTPTAENTEQWAAHWVVADRGTFNEANQVFGGSYTLEDNAAPFSLTDRGYIWGYSSFEPNEWILLSDPTWTWPDANDPLAFPRDWAVNKAEEVIVGQVDPEEAAFFVQLERVSGGSPSPRVTGDQWLVANFSPEQFGDIDIVGWDRDPDGDGLDNLQEFAFGTSPQVVDRDRAPIVEVVDVGGRSFLQMTVFRDPSVTLEFAVEATSGFAFWVSGPLETDTLVDTPQMLVVRDKAALDFVDSRFLRLTLTLVD